jgi:diguanylate cyclase (GGDEF)-like protein
LRLQSERFEKQAHTDYPTKLPNRKAFDKLFHMLVRKGDPFGLLLLDVDDLKGIDDTYGHMAGNSVLIQVGLRVLNQLQRFRWKKVKQKKEFEDYKSHNLLSKWGGDEFAAILDVENRGELVLAAQMVSAAVSKSPFLVHGYGELQEIFASVSIGGGIYQGQGLGFFSEVDEQALFRAKKEGKNRIVILG